VFTITTYEVVSFICLFLFCIWNQSIPINNHTNLRHWLVIDHQYQLTNWYQLTLIVIDYWFYRLDTAVIGQLETRYFVEYIISDLKIWFVNSYWINNYVHASIRVVNSSCFQGYGQFWDPFILNSNQILNLKRRGTVMVLMFLNMVMQWIKSHLAV